MSAEHLWVAPGDVVTDVTGRVNIPADGAGFSVTSQADEGSVGSSEIIHEDPDGNLYMTGLNAYRIRETSSEADDPYIFGGHMERRVVVRENDARTGTARNYRTSLVDTNALLSRYLFRPDEDAERPEETDEERLTWLLGTVAGIHFTDTRYIVTDDPVTMSAADFRGRTPLDVLQDMARQSGNELFTQWSGDLEEYALCYFPQSSTLLTTDLRISNVIADVEGDADTFYPLLDSELLIDPTRVASGFYARGENIEAYIADEDTASEFGRRDLPMDEPFVRSLPVLQARVRRTLGTVGTEELVGDLTIIVPAAKATKLKAGYRLQVKMSHWPGGFDEWTWVRALRCTHTQLTKEFYSIRVEVTPPTIPPPSPPVYGILRGSGGPFNTEHGNRLVYWAHTGDNPGPGYDQRPTTGDIEALEDLTPVQSNRTWYAWKVTGTGTIDVAFQCSFAGVGESVTVTWAIQKNGVVIADVSQLHDYGGYLSGVATLIEEGISVVPDDIITVTLTPSVEIAFWRTPAGIGDFSDRFEIFGGSLS